MSQRLNLNDNVEDTFPFSVGGHDFDLRYPTLEEIEPLQKIIFDREAAEKAGDTEKLTAYTEQLMDTIYSFIIYAGNENPAPTIKDVLKKQNSKVIAKFNEMMINELKS